ncbi:hypothetical protein HYFRA_00012318 [Hymenoscyphus fraxineus]|uniref:Uncharacterized protein n=1 Tax=Hymenoscyphus fraxineus TaxID=746836 RepID=A0A9N9L2A0_9HELO|nr:hypothetical protein HYFRA_00012318 [Hymenoscyphus fraxineus]
MAQIEVFAIEIRSESVIRRGVIVGMVLLVEVVEVGFHIAEVEVILAHPVVDEIGNLVPTFCVSPVDPRVEAASDEHVTMYELVEEGG